MIRIPFCREFEALQVRSTPLIPTPLFWDIDEKLYVCVHKGAVTFGELSPNGFVFFGMQVNNVRSFATSTRTEMLWR